MRMWQRMGCLPQTVKDFVQVETAKIHLSSARLSQEVHHGQSTHPRLRVHHKQEVQIDLKQRISNVLVIYINGSQFL
jgi:hypothetical protein